ncbi:coiled-coil domain-containing protein 142 isoform 2-T2 [Morphnus guianensis]
MEDGGPERRGGEPCLQVGEGDGAGLSGLIFLLRTARPPLPPLGDVAARGEPAETGSSSLGGLARSLQKAEAMLRSCVSPGLRRLLPPRPRQRGYDGSEDEEEEEETPALLAPLEQSFQGLRRCLCVWEDPRTETFRGHVRPQPGDGTAAFSYHPVHPRVAERGAALHALLQHRHHLRLARDYSRRLKAASDFLRQLLALVEQPEPPAGELGATWPLQGLCQELRMHAGHWSGLRRRMRSDPWLRPLLLRRHESVAHMQRALLLLALHATRLAERHAEVRLRGLARASPAVAPSPALLSDLFQGLEIYNQVVGDLALELGTASCLPAGVAGCHGVTGDRSHAFPAARVLGILAAERGWLVAERLQPLLQRWDGGGGAEHVCWEDATVPWPPEHSTTVAADTGPSGREELPCLAGELKALCREDEELMGLILGGLVASADSLWHHVLHGPKQEKPVAASPEPLELPASSTGTAARPSSAGWKSVRWLDTSRAPAAEALHAQYRPLFWGAAGAALGHRLGLPHCGAGRTVAAARELSRTLAQARVPRECEEELGRLCLRLLCWAVLWSWERDFTCALGSGLSDKCSGEPALAAGPVRSRTAWCLQRLYPALAFALRCLRPLPACLPGCPPGSPCLRLQVLGCCLATAQAACSWLMGRACRYLAAWALPQFLLVTQGDLQVRRGQGPMGGCRAWAVGLAAGQDSSHLLFPPAAEDGDREAGGAGEWDLPGAWGCPPTAAPGPAVPPGAPALPADSLHGCQHSALLRGGAEDVLHRLQADVGRDLRPDHAAGQALEGRPPRRPAQLPQRIRGGGGPGGAGPGAAGRPAPAPRCPGARPGPGDHGFPGGLDGSHPGPEDQVQPAGSLAAAAGLRAGAGAGGVGALRAGPGDPAVPALPPSLPADGRGHPLPPAAARRGGRGGPPPLALPAPLLLGRRCPRAGAGCGQPARPGDPGNAGGGSSGDPSVRRCRGAGAATERRPRVLPVGQPAAVAVAAASPGPTLARTRTALRRQQPRVLTARGGNKGAEPGVPVSVSAPIPFPVPSYGWERIPAHGWFLHPQHGRSIAPAFPPAIAPACSTLEPAPVHGGVGFNRSPTPLPGPPGFGSGPGAAAEARRPGQGGRGPVIPEPPA